MKPAIQVRKPPPLDQAEAFVRGDVQTSEPSSVQVPERSAAQPSKPSRDRKAVLERIGGRKVRRMTVYLPVDLATRLAVTCAKQDRDLSDVIAEAVERLGV